jgi:hypothetical protein
MFGEEERFASDSAPRVLHLTFHKGCANEFAGVAEKLGLNLDTWIIQTLPPGFFDGQSYGDVLYNFGEERAQRIWDLHKEKFLSYDVIVTSDIAPLSRIFLQNNFSKPLIIWICNRFDYYDAPSLDCDFPDKKYYELFSLAGRMPNVRIVAYTEFEHAYAKLKGIDTGDLTITPCGLGLDKPFYYDSIPDRIVKKDNFFIPNYYNDNRRVADYKRLFIPCYNGPYNGARDLEGFKAVIHLPYAVSNLALFQYFAVGLPVLVPSYNFQKELITKNKNSFHDLDKNSLSFAEWYNPKYKDAFIYFNSWRDLKYKTQTIDYEKYRPAILNLSREIQKENLNKWFLLFKEFSN